MDLKLGLVCSTDRTIFVELIWKCFVHFQEHIGFELSIPINLAFDLFVLHQGLFDAIFGVELRISTLVYVVKYFEWNVNFLDFRLVFQLIYLLQSGDQRLAGAKWVI